MKITKESLPCVLDNTELREFGQRNARAVRELLQIRSDKKTKMAEFKERIDEKEAEIRGLTDCVNSGREWRGVEVKTTYHRTENTASIIRCDTGEVVRTRPMTPEEQQGVLDLMLDDDD